MVNKIILIGNLGKDPEVRHLESGVAVAKFSLATNESYKDRTTGEWQTLTEWHDIVAWRGLAERAERDLKKGKLAYVEGKLTHRKYQDKEGNDRYISEIVANSIRLLEKRESSNSNYGSNFPTVENAPAMANTNSAAPSPAANTASPANNNTAAAPDDDLPF